MATRKKNESSFESSLKELEEVVQSLESSQVNLEEHLKLYEKGVTLIHLCQS
ncbi:MAG: exodeoxyribonuclease VII small subunit, partial [Cyclobacteriaceae bacterium]|nr:exodeoxyribonuclease VII small subunit [Cyclobacteriaceae bacterium]